MHKQAKPIKPKTTDWSSSSSVSLSPSSSPSSSPSHSPSLMPMPMHYYKPTYTKSSSNERTRSSSNRRTSNSRSDTSSPMNEELRMPTVLPAKLNYSEKIAKKMRKIFQLHDKIAPFDSYYLVGNLFYIYLFKKYKMDCIMPYFSIDIQFNAIPLSHDIDIERNVAKIFTCINSGSKIIIIPFNFNVFVDAENFTGHSNLLIYRVSTGTIEHFEPHGSFYGGIGRELVEEQMDAFLKKMISELNFSIKYENKGRPEHEKMQKITMIPAYNSCPDEEGLQALEEASIMPRLIIEPEGYCMAWSMFFTELCLKNPERSSRDIYDAIMEQTELYSDKNTYLRNIIRGYTCFINNKIAKHFSHIFNESEIPQNIKTLLANEMDQERREKIREKIIDIIDRETGDIKHPSTDSHISSKTSSSSLKEGEHVSPPKTKKASRSSKKKTSKRAV